MVCSHNNLMATIGYVVFCIYAYSMILLLPYCTGSGQKRSVCVSEASSVERVNMVISYSYSCKRHDWH